MTQVAWVGQTPGKRNAFLKQGKGRAQKASLSERALRAEWAKTTEASARRNRHWVPHQIQVPRSLTQNDTTQVRHTAAARHTHERAEKTETILDTQAAVCRLQARAARPMLLGNRLRWEVPEWSKSGVGRRREPLACRVSGEAAVGGHGGYLPWVNRADKPAEVSSLQADSVCERQESPPSPAQAGVLIQGQLISS